MCDLLGVPRRTRTIGLVAPAGTTGGLYVANRKKKQAAAPSRTRTRGRSAAPSVHARGALGSPG